MNLNIVNSNLFQSPKRIILILRFVLILATILVMTYSARRLDFGSAGYSIALVYLLFNCAIYLVPNRIFNKPYFSFLTILFDIFIITLAIYMTEGIQSDFYLVYFLAIFISSLGQDLGNSFFVAIVISLFYGWLLFRTNAGITLWDSKFLIRIPFLFIVSFISNYWATSARRELKKKQQLEKTNVELKEIIDREIAREIELKLYYERIINSVPSGIIAVKQDGLITTLNPEAERVLGRNRDEITGVNIKDVPMLVPLWNKIAEPLARGRNIARDEIELANPRGEQIPLGYSTSTIQGPQENSALGVVVVFKDLSQIRGLEEKLKHSERLSYLGKMASWVAHEIRNPLTAIAGFAQLLPTAKNAESVGLYSREICKGADRVNNIIDDILSFARSKEVVSARVRIRPMIDEIIKQFTADITVGGMEDPTVMGEYESLRRVFVNLIQNALDAIKDRKEKGRIAVNFKERDGRIEITFRDNGQGVEEKNIKRIFTPFFTTKERGTGLGLAIVKKIVEEHKGTIDLASRRGAGTTVTVVLAGAIKAKEKE